MPKIIDWVGGAVVGVILSALIAHVTRVHNRRGKRAITLAITGFEAEKIPLAIVGVPLRARPGSTELTQQLDALPLFGYGPFVSYATIATKLMQSQAPSAEIVLPEIAMGSQYEQLSEDNKRDRDLLVLGYPAGNDAARILEPLMKLPVHFASGTDRGLVLNETGEKIAKPTYMVSESGACRTTHDCGLIARVNHPLNPQKSILYLAGCETFGVKIAAEFLKPNLLAQVFDFGKLRAFTWKHRWVPTLGLSRARRTEFLAIVAADVQYLATGKPVLMWSWIRTQEDPAWRRIHPCT